MEINAGIFAALSKPPVKEKTAGLASGPAQVGTIPSKPDGAELKTNLEFPKLLAGYMQQWSSGQQKSRALLHTLPPSVRPQIEAQLLLNRLDLQTQLLTRTADAVGTIVRRTQQMGS